MARRRPEIHAQKFWRKFNEPISRKSRLKITKIPHWLNISKKLFRENKKNRFFPGWGPSLSDRSPPKTYSEKFSAKFNAAFRSVARSRNPRPPMENPPRRDRSGWFLIEKTTILTNSCCLYVQPTFGYARGSAFGVALRTEGWLFVWLLVWQAAVLSCLVMSQP